MSHLEASAPIFKVHLIPYTLMIYLHIDMKAAFIIHAIINRKSIKKKKSIKHPQDAEICL